MQYFVQFFVNFITIFWLIFHAEDFAIRPLGVSFLLELYIKMSNNDYRVGKISFTT